jgi:hypothetical protein
VELPRPRRGRRPCEGHAAVLSGKPTSQVKIKFFGICEGFGGTAPLAEFIRNSWTVRYDERIVVDLSSDQPLGDIVKRFSGMQYEFVKRVSAS